MNEILAIFLTWQFVVLCLGISAATFVVRSTVEYSILNNPKMPGDRNSRFWREFVLVILPIILGFLFAIFGKSFQYPDAIHDPYSKALFAASAGLFSPTLYRVIKALLWRNVQAVGPSPFYPSPYNSTPYNSPLYPTGNLYPPTGGYDPTVPQVPGFPSTNPTIPISQNTPTSQPAPQNNVVIGQPNIPKP